LVHLKKDKKIIAIVGISGALFIFLQFYLLDYWEEQKLIEYAEVFQKGYNWGLENAVYTIYNNTENCNVSSIFVGNSSKYIIDFSCTVKEMDQSMLQNLP